jgi:hypothetical protein
LSRALVTLAEKGVEAEAAARENLKNAYQRVRACHRNKVFGVVSTHWLRWGEALADAGYAPNLLQTRASDEVIVEKYIGLTREISKLPVAGEIRRKASRNAACSAFTNSNGASINWSTSAKGRY